MKGALIDLLTNELQRDGFHDDVTAALLGDRGREPGRGVIRAKGVGVFSGADVCAAVGRATEGRVLVEALVAEGQRFEVGETVVRLQGTWGSILGVERTLLNLLSHLCGVATKTRAFVDQVGNHPTRVLATRKTLPGLRELQLQAVRAGGGWVHRRSLSDGILIKENHQELVPSRELITRARARRSPLHRIEVEVQSLDQLRQILSDPPEVIMLDNFSLAHIAEALKLIGARCEVEVSGGVDLATAGAVAKLGVNYISVGGLTHSANAVDLSLDLER